jgi:hypothetical protein
MPNWVRTLSWYRRCRAYCSCVYRNRSAD